MFQKAMNYINLSGEEMPIRCDLLVLEEIQDRFGELSDFENKLIGFTPALDEEGNVKKDKEGRTLGISGTPDIKALNFALLLMGKEGTEITGKDIKEDKKLLQMADMTPKELSEELHKEFLRCFERKNQNPT